VGEDSTKGFSAFTLIAVEAASAGTIFAFPAGSRENFRDCPDEHAAFATANSAAALTIAVV